MKTSKIIFWSSTVLLVLFESVMTAFTFNTEMAREGIARLGYPDHFRVLLSLFKIAGGIALIIPVVPGRIKEWAYAGFGINLISAAVANTVADGPGASTLFPLVIMVLLVLSYITYHKIEKHKTITDLSL